MKMANKIIVVVFSCLLFMHGCSKKHYHANEQSAQPTMQKMVSKSINVSGNIELKIINNPNHPVIAFAGKEEDLKDVEVNTVDDHITVSRPSETKNSPKVVLTANTAKSCSININGPTIINTNSSKPIDMSIMGSHDVKIMGPINLSSLVLGGTGKRISIN